MRRNGIVLSVVAGIQDTRVQVFMTLMTCPWGIQVRWRDINDQHADKNLHNRDSEGNSRCHQLHYSDVIVGMLASQITSLTVVYSPVYSGAENIKTPRLWPLCGSPVNSAHKWPVTWKIFPFDDVIFWLNYCHSIYHVRTCISNCNLQFYEEVITHPFPNFNYGLTDPPLEVGDGWVITYDNVTNWIWLHILGPNAIQAVKISPYIFSKVLPRQSYQNNCRFLQLRWYKILVYTSKWLRELCSLHDRFECRPVCAITHRTCAITDITSGAQQ